MPRSPQFAPPNAKVKAKPTGGTLATKAKKVKLKKRG